MPYALVNVDRFALVHKLRRTNPTKTVCTDYDVTYTASSGDLPGCYTDAGRFNMHTLLGLCLPHATIGVALFFSETPHLTVCLSTIHRLYEPV